MVKLVDTQDLENLSPARETVMVEAMITEKPLEPMLRGNAVGILARKGWEPVESR